MPPAEMSSTDFIVYLSFTLIFLGPYFVFEGKRRGTQLFGYCLGALGTAGCVYAAFKIELLSIPSTTAFFYVAVGALLAFAGIALMTNVVVTLRNNERSALADEDAEIMEQRIYYKELGPHNEQLTGPEPYIDFYISLINASVLEITWEHELEGLLHLDGHQLQRSLVIAPREPPQQLQTGRGRASSIAIRQWLTRDNVTYMSGSEEIQFAFGAVKPKFSFDHRGQKHTFAKQIALGNNNAIWKNPNWARIQQSVNRLVTEVPSLVKDIEVDRDKNTAKPVPHSERDNPVSQSPDDRPRFDRSEVTRVQFQGDHDKPDWLRIFIFIRLRNLGSDSAVEGWEVHLEGQHINAIMPEAGLSRSLAGDVISPHEGGNLLGDKTIITKRGRHEGWLLWHEPKERLAGLTTGTESRVFVTVSFRDTDGNTYILPKYRQ